MNAEATSTGVSLETLQQQLAALEARVAALETEVEHEHEDIEKLKSVTREDHQQLESLKVSGSVVPKPRVTIGL
jgi:flagellar biosynthesis chaperone FliJ